MAGEQAPAPIGSRSEPRLAAVQPGRPEASPEIRVCATVLAAAGAGVLALYFAQLNAVSNPVPAMPQSLLAAAPATLLKDIDPATAVEINRNLPLSAEPNPAADSFEVRGDDLAYLRALHCLTSAIYYEAAHESTDGQRAVAQVVLNRVRHPAFPKSVCTVVFEGSTRRTGCQFSFSCDGALRQRPHPILWARARAVAVGALDGAVYAPVGNATHYHANYVVPYWATSLAKNATVGTHIFYRWMGWWGQPPAFRSGHSGQEPDPALLRHAAMRVRGSPPKEALPVSTDPRLELVSIIHFLAASDDAQTVLESAHGQADAREQDPTTYEGWVRSHFEGFSEHTAVQMYRELREVDPSFGPEAVLKALMYYSDPPEMKMRSRISRDLVEAAGGADSFEDFIAALRDFADQSDFAAFYDERRPYYAELQEQAREPTLKLLATVERDSAGVVPEFRLLLAPLLKDMDASGCEPSSRTKSAPWILVAAEGSAGQSFKHHAMLAAKLTKFASSGARMPPPACRKLVSLLSMKSDRKPRS